jgi:hypothetical protein
MSAGRALLIPQLLLQRSQAKQQNPIFCRLGVHAVSRPWTEGASRASVRCFYLGLSLRYFGPNTISRFYFLFSTSYPGLAQLVQQRKKGPQPIW